MFVGIILGRACYFDAAAFFIGGADMRSLKKNMQKLHYSLYSEEIKVYQRDENGDIVYADDGEGNLIPVEIGVVPGYFDPVLFYANISAGKGSAQEAVFGSDVDYTRTISTTDMSCQIDELSRIWIDNEIKYNDDGTVNPDSADYKVAAYPAKGLDNIVIAIKKLPKGGSHHG